MVKKFYRKQDSPDLINAETGHRITATEFGEGNDFEEISKPVGDLSGTMTKKTNEHDLPNHPSQTIQDFNNLKDAINMVVDQANANKPSIRQVLNDFRAKIGADDSVVNPNIVGGVVSGETDRFVESMGSVYDRTMRTIEVMEKSRIETQKNANIFLSNLAEAGVLHQLGGEEINNVLKVGYLSNEGLQKLSEIMASKEQERDTQIVTANGRKLLIDMQTAETIKDLGGAYKEGGGGDGNKTTNFTSQELRKLEQAGLANADRQEQLDYLYGNTTDQTDYEYAKSILDTNPDASYNELKLAIQENTELNNTEIDTLLVDKKQKMNEENKQFITKDYIKTLYGKENLEKAAKRNNYKIDAKWYKPSFMEDADTEAYLEYLMNTINEMRKRQLTDKEIYKELFE